MLRRTLIIAASLLVMMAAPAGAQEYPTGSDESLTVDDSTVSPGETLSFEGRSFAPGSTAEMTMFSEPTSLGTFTADGNGVVAGDVTIPADATAGTHRLELAGTAAGGGPQVLVAEITVVRDGAAASDDADSDGLAFTGTSVATVVGVGVVLLVLGAGALVASRRRSVA